MFIQLETSFTEKGFGILVIPWKTLSTLGFLSVSSNVSLCNSLTKNKNNRYITTTYKSRFFIHMYNNDNK